jgi:hypothetical protein
MPAQESVSPGAKKKRKRRKRIRPVDAPTPPRRAELDADGRDRPRFLLSFPEHPELEKLIAAYEAGNYALVRKEAPRLAERADDPAVRDAALELRRRIDPDPLAKFLLLAGVLLLVFLTAYAYLGNRQ